MCAGVVVEDQVVVATIGTLRRDEAHVDRVGLARAREAGMGALFGVEAVVVDVARGIYGGVVVRLGAELGDDAQIAGRAAGVVRLVRVGGADDPLGCENPNVSLRQPGAAHKCLFGGHRIRGHICRPLDQCTPQWTDAIH